MATARIYLDTSVFGGCFDSEFDVWSNRLMEDFRHKRLFPVLSVVLQAEVRRAPPIVQDLLGEIEALAGPVLDVSSEALDLLAAYERKGILAAKFRADLLHIALATTASVDALASWNFRHIVRFDKIRRFNEVNSELGYGAIAIHSPREIASDEDDRTPLR